MTGDVDALEPSEFQKKLAAKLEACVGDLDANQLAIVNDGDRYRHGEPISTGFVESAVNQVISKRFVKKQQIRWLMRGAHALLQLRTREWNGELRAEFERWYPAIAAHVSIYKVVA